MTPEQLVDWRRRLGMTQAAAAQSLGLGFDPYRTYEVGTARFRDPVTGKHPPRPIPLWLEYACAWIYVFGEDNGRKDGEPWPAQRFDPDRPPVVPTGISFVRRTGVCVRPNPLRATYLDSTADPRGAIHWFRVLVGNGRVFGYVRAADLVLYKSGAEMAPRGKWYRMVRETLRTAYAELRSAGK